MSDGRDYLLRVWQLAEELAVQSGKPLHAFLLLHHVLTQPPPQLRSAGVSTKSAAASSSSTAAASTPLHVPSLDAEWKCEELATRVRAAEYLLFPDVARPVGSSPAAEGLSGNAALPFVTSASPPAHTLSRAAALESLELAEQVLAPVFAASSHTGSSVGDGRSNDQNSIPQDMWNVHASGMKRTLLDTALSEVAQTTIGGSGSSPASARTVSAAAPSPHSPSFFKNDSHGGVGVVETRAASMYFFSESTVTALAWPLTYFTLAWPFSMTSPSPTAAAAPLSLSFKSANQTIMIAVALVVRAHLLQAVVCHRRVQYRRALQCLAEARKWVQQQFTESAQTRSLRLLWADLQERWCSSASCSASRTETASASPLLSCPHLPHFDRLMTRLMELERRACEAMISVEECKVHFLILQSCGSLPPPPLLLPLSPSYSEGSAALPPPAAGIESSAHAPDLRLHYKRYHESVLQLHEVSWVYVRLLQWVEEDEMDDDNGDEQQGVRVKRENGERDARAGASLPREHARRVQRQLSPFCLCALHHGGSYSEFHEQHAHVVSVKAKSETNKDPVLRGEQQQRERPTGWLNSTYVVNYDKRLAAEVLGFYHCMSFLYVLYQHASTATSASNNHNASQRLRVAEKEQEEAEFFTRYAGVLAHTPPFTARSPSTSAASHNAVQRALMHCRIYAFVFGAFSPCGDDADGDSTAAAGRWRSHLAGAGSSSSSAPTAVHEAGLLLCLAELALKDDFPFALQFCSAFKEGAVSSARTAVEENRPSDAAVSSAVKKEADEEVEGGRRPPAQPQSQQARSSLLAPPSWNWVVPGLRTILQLYVALMTVPLQAAATMPASTPPLSPAVSAMRLAAVPAPTAAAAAGTTPPVPILQAGLQRAEQLLARLLFTLDREMLHLTGNAWTLAAAPAAGSATTRFGVLSLQPQHRQSNQSGASHRSGDGSSSVSPRSFSPWMCADHLQSSPPAQLRWLVQIKAAALLTMARHHLTQLSIVRAVHHLREVQQFARVFHRQAKLSLLPEMHVLLAAVATCMSLRRLPDLSIFQKPQLHGHRRGLKRSRASEATLSEGEEGEGHPDAEIDEDGSGEGTPSTHPADAGDAGFVGEVLYAFAQGWPSADSAPPSSAAFSIPPREEATIAQDVGLPYLHLLAAERAACTSLYTPPSLLLLLYLMKAWVVYQLVATGEEVTWAAPERDAAAAAAEVERQGTDEIRQRQQQQQSSAAVALSPLSPACPPLPLPTASYATTSLNTTVEDQQRRIARLDSLTSTPTSTPTLRGRHATLPAEMQRIQLEQLALPPPVISPVKPVDSVAGAQDSVGHVQTSAFSSLAGGEEVATSSVAAGESVAVGPPPSPSASLSSPVLPAALHEPKNAPTDAVAAPTTLSPPEPPLPPPPSSSFFSSAHRTPRSSPKVSSIPVAQTTSVALTVRHRAGDVLQRMMAVLQHHYEAYALYTTSSATQVGLSSASRPVGAVPSTAWTPQNVTLLRLLRGAVLLTEDRDEPAAVRELKETTHYAKQHLGVLHPYVADGLALLTNAYASLDVDTGSSGGNSLASGTGEGTSPSSLPQDSATRTRRVAVQLAMRCSCTALASLALSGNTSSPSPFTKPPTGTTSRGSGVGDGEGSAAAATVDALDSRDSDNHMGGASALPPPQQQQQQLTVLHSRLREWWSTQVLEELCGNGSVHRSMRAVKQLRILLHWLPETAEKRL
ncbi:hypothetical protein ABB37_02654 [Leptomonas pyrrhocoris]|uniref:Uncharacterized protein n=1 Tax=Leptomonas pyrrhocoris TaxID=157538 RepID=A0A0M9G5S2_LEPPY|nr:hypothetical protein ABB37_02654 [Leptomonas pyrrhocoris]KPA82897.1 hypothetical protein ABB37_02654 [Leptomonas pyrrhocoris]|eukprot:XP_015661336.1 hypothetical protein ABB37_02654 [Leptomonas pyrrhocoris]